MKTLVYIDGFNLYYGAVKNTPYKWLNVRLMCEALLPQNNVAAIKYYTARVSARPHDPDQPLRQQVYLRALSTIAGLEIVYGQFLTSVVSMPVHDPPPNSPRFSTVIKTEEKGSDVNIAAHMVHDGHLARYECAVIVSNDSDLVEPVKIVRHELGLPVGMLNPHKHPSRELTKLVTFMKKIRKGVLRMSQFPDRLHDNAGTFQKPNSW